MCHTIHFVILIIIFSNLTFLFIHLTFVFQNVFKIYIFTFLIKKKLAHTIDFIILIHFFKSNFLKYVFDFYFFKIAYLLGPISHLMFVSWYCSFQKKKNHRFLDNYLTVSCFACWISFAWLAFLWFWISSLKFGFSLPRSQLFFISVWFDHFFLFRLGNHDCYISFLFLFSIWLSFLCINHMNL